MEGLGAVVDRPQFIAVKTGEPDFHQIYEFSHTEETGREQVIAGPLIAVEEQSVYRKYKPLEMTIFKTERAAVDRALELNNG